MSYDHWSDVSRVLDSNLEVIKVKAKVVYRNMLKYWSVGK